MNGFIQGMLGGIVPGVIMILIYFMTMSGRLAKIETDICWIIKELNLSQRHSKSRSR